MFDEHLYAFHQFLTQAGETVLGRDEFFREWSVDEIYEMVIEGSDTDMIVAQPLPLTDLFHDGLSPWEKCAEMAAKHPDRAVFWGSVNPLEGKRPSISLHPPGGGPRREGVQVLQRPLRLRAAVPLAHGRPPGRVPGLRARPEARREPGRRPQGVPLGPQPVEHTRTFDMDRAAASCSPTSSFVIFVGLPWLDEVLWQIVRFPNLYASIAATVSFILATHGSSPRRSAR